jgi:DNA uptake protein ComE-like DNA-binding protein
MGRVFTSSFTNPGVSFAAALRANTQQTPHRAPQVGNTNGAELGTPTPAMVQQQHKESGQSAQAPNVNSASLNNMFRVASVGQVSMMPCLKKRK